MTSSSFITCIQNRLTNSGSDDTSSDSDDDNTKEDLGNEMREQLPIGVGNRENDLGVGEVLETSEGGGISMKWKSSFSAVGGATTTVGEADMGKVSTDTGGVHTNSVEATAVVGNTASRLEGGENRLDTTNLMETSNTDQDVENVLTKRADVKVGKNDATTEHMEGTEYEKKDNDTVEPREIMSVEDEDDKRNGNGAVMEKNGMETEAEKSVAAESKRNALQKLLEERLKEVGEGEEKNNESASSRPQPAAGHDAGKEDSKVDKNKLRIKEVSFFYYH